ncbi:MAG: molybdenum cofactor biosynthesis protein [Nitrospirae bacterium 13_2_20CM_2_61_4]|nr:MAG: molybdenum cofactor biosynthesis protein [Nitrospirae bacterium 13_2_20CM_2_61_4]
MGHQEHKAGLPKSIGCMVITCSDSRTVETDTSGAAIMEMLKEGGHRVAAYHSRRDSTFEAVDSLLEKRLEGFGEIFRYLSFKDIGSAAMMSRATAGLYQNRIIISIPGSEKAVRLAMEQLILNELGHMVREMTK